jgi:hypothetical protein
VAQENSMGTLGALLLVFIMVGAGASSDNKNTPTNPVDTCNDGIDNDGDGFFDFTDYEQSTDDMDCDPDNPNYTGEEDGNANQYQNSSPP